MWEQEIHWDETYTPGLKLASSGMTLLMDT